MPPVFINGFTVLVEDGMRFDLARVLDACEELVDACAADFGVSAPIIRTTHERFDRRVSWPDPGRGLFRDAWIEAGKAYDVVYEALVAALGPACLKIFPLGMTWCVYRAKSDALVAPDGRPIEELDPTPTIRIYGAETGPNSFEIASVETVDAIDRLLDGPLAHLKLILVRSAPTQVSIGPARLGCFASIALPHPFYGQGHGPIRVRCVTKDE